jgi:hypothetical protein
MKAISGIFPIELFLKEIAGCATHSPIGTRIKAAQKMLYTQIIRSSMERKGSNVSGSQGAMDT